MAEQTIVANINGYWRDQQIENLRPHPGIFFVYEAKYHAVGQTVDLLRLIYVGEATNIRERLCDRELQAQWRSLIGPGNELCFAWTVVENYYRNRVAVAYIHAHNPPGNPESNEAFTYDATTVISTGHTALIYPVITVKRSNLLRVSTPTHFRREAMIPARAVQLHDDLRKPRRIASGE